MAYNRYTNLDARGQVVTHRSPDQKAIAHRYYQSHQWTTEIPTAAPKTLSKLIEEAGYDPLFCRTHVAFTNSGAAGTLYLGMGANLSASLKEYALAPGDHLKLPLEVDADPYLLASAAGLVLIVTEWG